MLSGFLRFPGYSSIPLNWTFLLSLPCSIFIPFPAISPQCRALAYKTVLAGQFLELKGPAPLIPPLQTLCTLPGVRWAKSLDLQLLFSNWPTQGQCTSWLFRALVFSASVRNYTVASFCLPQGCPSHANLVVIGILSPPVCILRLIVSCQLVLL